jgi:molybdopterin biosynthesis enzyme
MMRSNIQASQHIARLLPLDQALAALDAVTPVPSRDIATQSAYGRILAADAVGSMRPTQALALRDGWAMRSDLTLDVTSYAPTLLASPPLRLDAGDPLPADSDAVAPLDSVIVREDTAEVMATVVPCEGVLLPGIDVEAGRVLRHKGERLSETDIAALCSAGLAQVSVREPRITVFRAQRFGAVADAAAAFVARAVAGAGGVSPPECQPQPSGAESMLQSPDFDAAIVIGGTGTGRHDTSVDTLRRIGRVEFHGIGLTPGETLAFGWIDAKPVLLLPGRLDAVLAGWLIFGRRLVAKLCGAAQEQDEAREFRLSRKVTSTIGMAEIVPVRVSADGVEPLASGYLPLSSLVSDGWILVPPEREGYAAGSPVMVRPWP